MNSEILAFSTLVEKLYAKMAETGISTRPKFEFILRISNDVDTIKSNFEAPFKKFMDNKTISKVMEKIPKDLIINGDKVLDVLFDKIGSINMQLLTIAAVKKNICLKISYKLPTKYESLISHWIQSAADKEHMLQVKNSAKSMTEMYELYHEKFNNEMKAMNNISNGIERSIRLFNLSIYSLLAVTDCKQIAANIKHLYAYLDRVMKQQNDLMKNLEEVDHILDVYNMQRTYWAEFLVGLRKTLLSTRKSSK